MNSDQRLPRNSDRDEADDNDGFDAPDSGIFDMRRDFHRLGDPKPSERKLENDEELAGDPLGPDTHHHPVAEQEDAP